MGRNWVFYAPFLRLTKNRECSEHQNRNSSIPQLNIISHSPLFHSSEGWATCSPGFFLRGFHRGFSDELKSIQWATCCKPSLHPYSYPDCYDQDAGQENLRQCRRDGFLLVGLYRGAGEQLSSIKTFRCCKMLESKIIHLHQFFCASDYWNE